MPPTIRLAEESDGERIHEIYAPYVRDSAISFEETPPPVAEIERRITETIEQYPWLVCEHDERVVGYAYTSQHRSRHAYQWSVDCSVYVDAEYHRRGIARGLYESLFAICRLQGFYNAYAGTTIPNPQSVGFHESMGFESVGTYENVGYSNGGWYDVGWFALSLAEHSPDPEPPLSIEEARSCEGWDDALAAGEPTIRL